MIIIMTMMMMMMMIAIIKVIIIIKVSYIYHKIIPESFEAIFLKAL